MGTKPRTLRVDDDVWAGFVAYADSIGSTPGTLLRAHIAEMATKHASTPHYTCAMCEKPIEVGSPVIQYREKLYCNLGHAIIAVTDYFQWQLHEMYGGDLMRYVPAMPDLRVTLMTRPNKYGKTWLVGPRADALVSSYQWAQAHPKRCHTCGHPFSQMNRGELYATSSYGSHHLECLVPPTAVIGMLFDDLITDWLRGFNQTLREVGAEDKTVRFNPGTIDSGRWNGVEVAYA